MNITTRQYDHFVEQLTRISQHAFRAQELLALHSPGSELEQGYLRIVADRSVYVIYLLQKSPIDQPGTSPEFAGLYHVLTNLLKQDIPLASGNLLIISENEAEQYANELATCAVALNGSAASLDALRITLFARSYGRHTQTQGGQA